MSASGRALPEVRLCFASARNRFPRVRHESLLGLPHCLAPNDRAEDLRLKYLLSRNPGDIAIENDEIRQVSRHEFAKPLLGELGVRRTHGVRIERLFQCQFLSG